MTINFLQLSISDPHLLRTLQLFGALMLSHLLHLTSVAAAAYPALWQQLVVARIFINNSNRELFG